MLSQINEFFGIFVGFLYPIIFFDISFGYLNTALPLIVLVLLSGALIFTFYFNEFISNSYKFKKNIEINIGKLGVFIFPRCLYVYRWLAKKNID